MSDSPPPPTLNTNKSELLFRRFESAWLNWRKGEPTPDWRLHLPAEELSCGRELIFLLLQVDIECRVKAGLPALLSERYFEHPRLEREGARLDAEQQIELIRWEYQQRWQMGERPRRGEYQSAFPQFSEALGQLKPRSACPRCRQALVLEETAQTICCPHCNTEHSLARTFPPFVAPLSAAADGSVEWDLRGYELIECLGKGGMGEVYRGVDPALGRDLAIKVMKALRGDAEAEHRFVREARVTGSLQHPGIVPVFNLGRLPDGRLHYTMRLVRGRTFADILKEKAGQPEHWPELLAVFVKICQAVAYAHSKRVIHRDLKPHNVMVGNFGEVQVMDWGLAKLLSERGCVSAPSADERGCVSAPSEVLGALTQPRSPEELSRAGSGMGTPAYMPPEQARGEWDTVDERADVFALGAILCEILTGHPPYREDVFRRAERGEVKEAWERLERCGAEAALTALCRECLSPEYANRPSDAGVVAQRVADHQAEVQERLRQAELERVAAQTRAREEQARAGLEQERVREALARAAAERRATRRLLGLTAAVLLFVLLGAAGLAAAMLTVRAEQQRTQDALNRATDEQAKTWEALKVEQAARAQTREALNALSDDFVEELLSKQVALGEKEKAFLQKIIGFYERFAAQRGEGEQSRSVAAQGQFRVAKLRHLLGQTADAEKGYRASIGTLAKLADDFPAAAHYRHGLARGHTNLGALLLRLGRGAEAETEHRKALALQAKLVSDFADVPQYRQELANSHNSLGNVHHRLGKGAEAEAEYRQAAALQEKLVGAFPQSPSYRRELAGTYSNLGALLIARSQTGKAEAAYRQALSLRQKLVEDFPAVPQYRQDLASSHNNLGNLLSDLGRSAEAEAEYRHALSLRHKLAGDFPAVPHYRQELASSHSCLGDLLTDRGRYGEAEASLRQAILLQEKLAADFRDVPGFRLDLAGSCVNFGKILRGRNQPQAALDWHAKAISLLEAILAQDARLATARTYLRNAHWNRADALGQLGRHGEAAKDWLRALELDRGPMRPTLRLQYAVALARAGEHRAAVKAVEQLLASAGPKGKTSPSAALCYDAACVYALSAAAGKGNATLREQYAVRAVALLRQAQAVGFFKDPKQIDNMRKDADLHPLRQRDDFKKFLTELK